MSWELDDAVRKDAELVSALGDMSPAMEKARAILVEAIQHNFYWEASVDEEWQELAESTQKTRRHLGYGAAHPILERTGKLLKDATAHQRVGRDFAEVGVASGNKYAKYHASSAPRSIIPLRDFLAVGEKDLDRIDAAVVEFLESRGG